MQFLKSIANKLSDVKIFKILNLKLKCLKLVTLFLQYFYSSIKDYLDDLFPVLTNLLVFNIKDFEVTII